MKTLISIIAALTLIFCLASPALASTVEVSGYIDYSAPVPYVTQSLTLTSAKPGESSRSSDPLYVQNADTKLHIHSCTWLPQDQKAIVGFYNCDTGTVYGITFENGSVPDSFTMSSKNLPDGEYLITFMNSSSSTKSISGTLNYWVE